MSENNTRRLTLSDFERIAEQNARAEREANTAANPDAVASWESTLAILRYMREHGIPESLKDEEPS